LFVLVLLFAVVVSTVSCRCASFVFLPRALTPSFSELRNMFLKHVLCIGWKVFAATSPIYFSVKTTCQLEDTHPCLVTHSPQVNIHSCGVPGLKYNIKVSGAKGGRQACLMHLLTPPFLKSFSLFAL
jgi:hypothetical protein